MIRAVTQDLTALLLEFESSHRTGGAMDPQRLDQLRRIVRDALIAEYSAHADQIPVSDPVTRRIAWKSRRQLRGRRDLALWENVSDTPDDWLDQLIATLDRMLTAGARRDRSSGGKTPPRLAKQVADRLARGEALEEPMLLIVDCLKYAMYDEMLAAKRRIETGKARRARVAPRQRKSDQRSLLRRFGAQRLLESAAITAEDLAYCVAFEYQRGGLDRAAVAPLGTLPLGSATLDAVLDAVDRIFDRVDRELHAAAPGSTRRRPARAKGVGAVEFAAVLATAGCSLASTSLSSLYRRKANALARALA
jgi:hypothetical protein